MRLSFGSSIDQTAACNGWRAAARSRWAASRTRAVRVLLIAAAVLICAAHAVVAAANTVPAAGIGYLWLSVVMAGCAMSFWIHARLSDGALRTRWTLIAGAALAAAMGYLPSAMQATFGTPPLRVLQTVCFNASEALYLLAAVLFFAGVARSIVIVDLLQTMLFLWLRFHLVYSPGRPEQFTLNHLLIGQFMALFLFLVAMVACLGASSRDERWFLCTLSWFFGLRLIAFFLSNQVSYIWLHYVNCSRWDVLGVALLATFSLYLAYARPAAGTQAAAPGLHPAGASNSTVWASSLMVRSLMPSFLALVNLILGLFLLRISVTLAAVAISASLVCYVMRTALLQAQALKEKAALETRNQHLEGLAVRDPLTGIGNRRSLAEAYGRLQAETAGHSLTLLLTDIDQFKQANDCHGHLHGDRVLIALSRKLEQLAAAVPGSHCARMGGDEFALLLPSVNPQIAGALAEELRCSLGAHRFETGISRIGLSIGIASVEAGHDLPLETLVRYADQALYRAKKLGRNRVEVHLTGETRQVPGSAAVRLALQHTAS